MRQIERGVPGIVEFPCDVERLENGNTLICDAGDETGAGSEIIEVDHSGHIVWSFNDGLKFAHSAKRLQNGNTLISDTSNNRVIEVNMSGEIVFTSDAWNGGTGILSDDSHLNYPNDAHLLPDDSILITDRNNNRCVIVDNNGDVLWHYTGILKHPHNCDPLENGNILMADSDGGRILEVNRDKEIVWEFKSNDIIKLAWPRDADRIPGGNTLVADSRNSRIFELTPGGEIAWKYEAPYFANFYDADELSNGNILISDQQHHQVLEVDRTGNIVWLFRNYMSSNMINDRIKNGSFIKQSENGLPESWILFTRFSEGGGKLIWDKNVLTRPCPCLEFDRSGALFLQQMVAVRPGHTYKMAGTLRTRDISEGGFAYLQMAFVDELGGLIEDASIAPKGRFFTGDNDWAEDCFDAVAPIKAVAVELRFVISGKGKAWIKNIMFFEV